LLAQEWKCITLPPVPYSYPGASGPWPGTVDISVQATQDYIKAVTLALLKGGFKRIVICGAHGPLGWIIPAVIRDIFQSTGNVVVHLNIYNSELEAEGEDAVLLGAMKILGLHGAYDPSSKVNKPKGNPYKDITDRLGKHQVSFPWTYNADNQHIGMRTDIKMADAERMAEKLKKTARNLKDVPALFAKYQKEMKALYIKKPWSKKTVWTKTK